MPATRTNLASYSFLLILVAAALPCILMLFLGNPWGHDFDLHFDAWMDASQQFRAGCLYPRWDAETNYGFGQPFFIFYPPLSWVLGGTLGSFLPWDAVPGAYLLLAFLAAGASMWKCARDFLNSTDAAMAGALYSLSPYFIIMAFKRCSYGDLLASALFPLLVWAGIRMGHDAKKAFLPLVLVFAAIWLADLPAAVIASYSLALILVVGSIVQRSLRPIFYGGLAILAAFGSIAAFMLPAAWERSWVNIGQVTRTGFMPENNFLFTTNNTGPLLAFNKGLSLIALFLIVVAFFGAVVTRQLRRDAPADWRLLAALGGLSTFMMFSPSLILWRVLPELRFVGLPWRWLSPLSVVAVMMVSAPVAQTRRKWAFWLSATLVVLVIGASIVRHVSWDSAHLKETVAQHAEMHYVGVATWTNPIGSNLAKLPESAAMVVFADMQNKEEPTQQGPRIHIELWSPEQKVFSVEAPRPATLAIRLLSYPAWQAKLNGVTVPFETDHESGQMLLPVPAGISHAEIKFVRTWDRMIGDALSVATILVLSVVFLFLRLRKEKSDAREPAHV
jgi:uncharacterized membrane protein